VGESFSQKELERLLAELPAARGFRAISLEMVGSSCDVARECLIHRCAAVILAGRQSAGRGRHGRNWVSDRLGNLYLSLAWPCRPELSRLGEWSLALAERIAAALHRHFDLSLAVKPPNDLLLDGKKVAGILLEAIPWAGVAVGVGINLVEDPNLQSHCAQPVGSLAQRRSLSLRDVLPPLLTALLQRDERWKS
jgi:BirA family biotin operon repressor/biotin-[acetyl-CoA-carboxylase] ligase